MTTPTKGLEIAELAFYAACSIPSIYCVITHGKHGLLGWLYVLAMCGLRLAGNGMAYHALSTTGKPNTSASIISGIGLSPLLLAALGILHEANYSIHASLPPFLRSFGFLIPHLVIAGGIGLAAASSKNPHLLEAGLLVFGTGFLIVLALVIFSARTSARHQRMSGEKMLLLAVAIAMPLIGARVLYAIVVAFKFQNASGGSSAVRVIFGTIPEFLTMISYLAAGLVTRNLRRERVEDTQKPVHHAAAHPARGH